MTPEQHLDTLRAEDARFAAAATSARDRHGWRTPVPGCPGWDLADLAWHLAEVQHFWGWLVGTRATSPAGYPEPVRPADDGFGATRSRGMGRPWTRTSPCGSTARPAG